MRAVSTFSAEAKCKGKQFFSGENRGEELSAVICSFFPHVIANNNDLTSSEDEFGGEDQLVVQIDKLSTAEHDRRPGGAHSLRGYHCFI